MRRFVRPPLVCLRPIEQRSRPIVLTPTRRRNAGTGDLYPFQNAAFKKAHSYQRNTAPALSGLPPDPAPPFADAPADRDPWPGQLPGRTGAIGRPSALVNATAEEPGEALII